MSNPIASALADSSYEWIELYNYSNASVNLKNWSLKDEDSDSILISSVDLIIQPGAYILLASNKDSTEYNWFGGTPNASIIDYTYTNFNLANGTDEAILYNASSSAVWSIAYNNDEEIGVATFLEYTHDFSSGVTAWGTKSSPGIDRDSIDIASTTTGYEGARTSVDGSATSSILETQGSPLSGTYTGNVTTSVNELTTTNTLTIFPNPASTLINFSEIATGQIIDITGKTVATFINKKSISIENLSSGIFFIKIDNAVYKVIKE